MDSNYHYYYNMQKRVNAKIITEATKLRAQLDEHRLGTNIHLAYGDFEIIRKRGDAALILDKNGKPIICFSKNLYEVLQQHFVRTKRKSRHTDSYVAFTITKISLDSALVAIAPNRIDIIDQVLADLAWRTIWAFRSYDITLSASFCVGLSIQPIGIGYIHVLLAKLLTWE